MATNTQKEVLEMRTSKVGEIQGFQGVGSLHEERLPDVISTLYLHSYALLSVHRLS